MDRHVPPRATGSMPRILAATVALVPAAVAATGLGSGPVWAQSIVPHRALYELDLAAASSNSPVRNVEGRMLSIWDETCDGWNVEQRYTLSFAYTQGNSLELSSTFVTFETKDGTEFNFNLRNLTNGELDEELRGTGSLLTAGGAGEGRFRLPETTSIDLPDNTYFPSSHTLELIRRAMDGEALFLANMFDGTDLGAFTQVSSVMGPAGPTPVPDLAEAHPALLMETDAYRATLAFYPSTADDAVPEYEMVLRIHNNGIVDELLIDYGEFTVRGGLVDLEPLERATC